MSGIGGAREKEGELAEIEGGVQVWWKQRGVVETERAEGGKRKKEVSRMDDFSSVVG